MDSSLTCVLYVACLLVCTAQDCQYQYLQQPPENLSCNPFGSRLQLSCIASGPLDPQFKITWYTQFQITWHSSTANNTREIATTDPEYNIQQPVLNNSGDNQTIISSALTKDKIGDSDADRCVWCRIEIDGSPLPVQSNQLCILDQISYIGLPNCSVSPPPANTTPVCADPSGGVAPTGLAIQPQSATLFPFPTLSQTHSSSIYSTANINIIITITPFIEMTNANTRTFSQEYLHTELPPPNNLSTDNAPTTLRTGATPTTLSTGATMGIAVGVTGTIILLLGALAAVLVYYCISKHRSQLKSASTSYQQQQTDPEYEEVQIDPMYEVPATSGAEIELRENVAYKPVQMIELRENVAYGPVQH